MNYTPRPFLIIFMNNINFFLEILIISSIICSLIVITSTNPVTAIIYLIGVFLNSAIYLILIGIGFIGISYIIVYIGAITVLFLFVIMMINTDILDLVEIGPEYGKNLPLAYSITVMFFLYFLIFIPIFNKNYYNFEVFSFLNKIFYLSSDNISESLFNSSFSLGEVGGSVEGYLFNINFLHPEISLSNVLQIEILGELLYSLMAILIILSSLVLLLALVCPIILSR